MSKPASTDADRRGEADRASPVESALRKRILADPDFVLNDPELMRVLLSPAQAAGRNVVDLRGALIQRLETKLGRLTEAHRDVVAAAWDNMTGMEQIHRAVLAVIDADTFEAFVAVISDDFTELLNVDVVRLCLQAETAMVDSRSAAAVASAGAGSIVMLPPRALAAAQSGSALGPVTLRSDAAPDRAIFGALSEGLRSEALVRLDFGAYANPGLLAFGSTDPQRFHPEQGDDLLTFLGGVVERTMRGWMALGRTAGDR